MLSADHFYFPSEMESRQSAEDEDGRDGSTDLSIEGMK